MEEKLDKLEQRIKALEKKSKNWDLVSELFELDENGCVRTTNRRSFYTFGSISALKENNY